jgi:hypothetical protein
MSRGANSRARSSRERSIEDIHVGMIERLRAGQPEIVAAIVAHVASVYGSVGSEDAEYQAGLRAAVAAVVDYFLTGVEQGEAWSGPIPSAATTQARRAARNGVNLDTLVLRYIAGHRLLGEIVMDEADRSGFSGGPALRQLRRTQELLLERLMVVIANEYRQEAERVGRSAEQCRRELVQKLLAGERVNAAELGYDFDAWHLGMVATGARAGMVIRDLADSLGCQLLPIQRSDESLSAWLGKQRKFAVTDVERLLSAKLPASVSLVVGEPARGIEGWRLTHWQAEEALWVALRAPRVLTRYADVPLLAAALRDDALARSLKEIYLSPLGGDGGLVLRQTLRAYFENEHSTKAASAKLNVDRGTVRRRVLAVERRLGRLLYTCQAELAVALRLEELDESPCGADDEPRPARRLA